MLSSWKNGGIGTAICPAFAQWPSICLPQRHTWTAKRCSFLRPLPALPQNGVFLVFPFENAGASPRLEWIGEGLEELTIQKLSSAGQQVFSHEARLDQMDRAGLPANAKLSRATMLHIAQDLDADYVVFGISPPTAHRSPSMPACCASIPSLCFPSCGKPAPSIP